MLKALKIVFAAVYFIIALFIVNLIFRSTMLNVLPIICMLIGLIVSAGLADFTVNKLIEALKEEIKKDKL